jgi:hypothetical protein
MGCAVRHERSQLRLWIFVIVGLVAGLAFLILGTYLSDWSKVWSQIISAVGTAIFSSVALAALWEFWQKTTFTDEVLYRGEGMAGLRKAGVVSFSPRFQEGIPWDRLFRKAQEVDLFFTHAQGWRSNNIHLLEEFAKRKGQIRVALPDPDNDVLMRDLAERMQWNVADMSQGVRDAANFFIALGERHKSTVEVWYVPRPPLFTFYRFGSETVVAFGSHRLGKGAVPTFVVERAGDFEKYVAEEWEGLLMLPGSRRIHPTS